MLAVGLLLCGVGMTMVAGAWAQPESRKTKYKTQPEYPELARRMKITGVVKIQITVAANGQVKDTKVVGGHPVLANAVVDAVRKWRYEARPQESTETVEFRFDPNQ